MVEERNVKYSWFNRVIACFAMLAVSLFLLTMWEGLIQPGVSTDAGIAQVNGGNLEAGNVRLLNYYNTLASLTIWFLFILACTLTLWRPVVATFFSRKENV